MSVLRPVERSIELTDAPLKLAVRALNVPALSVTWTGSARSRTPSPESTTECTPVVPAVSVTVAEALPPAGTVAVPSAGDAVTPSGTSSFQVTVFATVDRLSDRPRVTVSEAPGCNDREAGEKAASTRGSGAFSSIVR